MRIEVATLPGTPTKQKGDLLESLAKSLLQTQNYTVATEIRLTATRPPMHSQGEQKANICRMQGISRDSWREYIN